MLIELPGALIEREVNSKVPLELAGLEISQISNQPSIMLSPVKSTPSELNYTASFPANFALS